MLFEYGALARCLIDLLHEAQAIKVIDFLSLGCESAELDVLLGISHKKYRFKYILVDVQRLSAYE